MKKNKHLILLILISFVALLLRLWKLGEVPPSMHWDEPSWGYNAYSILKTGRDEYGNFMPLVFKAFGDWKSAAYVYLTVPSVAIFGLNEFAVRFPAALFGAISVFLIFFVFQEIFKEFEKKEVVGIIASVVLAFSPWSYHYSHGAWEVNILLTFLLLGIYFFLKANEKPWFFYVSALFFGLCFYVYNSAKLLIPLIILGLALIFWNELKKIASRQLLISSLILLFMIMPVFKFTFFGGAGGRLKIMSVFSYPRSEKETAQLVKEEGGTAKSLSYQIFHGGPHYFLRGVLGRYLNHFSPRFLFFEGDWSNPRHSVPFAGVLNFLDILFLPLGVYFLISRKVKNKQSLLLRNQNFFWYLLLITPLPSALSRDIIQATRSYFMIIPLAVISAFGIYFVWEKLQRFRNLLKFGITTVLVLGYLFSFVYYFDQFFVHAPIQNSQEWQYGYKEAVRYVLENGKNYQKIVFTQKYGQPYIYYLFYSQYDPRIYQAQAKLIENPEGDVGRVEKLDNIDFLEIYWPKDRFIKDTLFIGKPDELPEKDIITGESRLLKKIYFLNGEPAFHIVETVK